MRFFHRKAFWSGFAAAVIVMAMIYAGSRGLKDFDWALSTYAAGTIFAAFAVAYRYARWAQRPPTRMYLKRGAQMFAQGLPELPKNTGRLGKLLLDNFVLQKFITERSTERWVMHACLSWGGMLAFAVTFPLVFGWLHFESVAGNAGVYRVFVMGYPVEEFAVHSLRGFIHFNVLNLSAVLMLLGLVLSVKLRMRDKGEIAIQTFADDVLPLLLLFTVCVTGLMLSVSSNFMAGAGFQFLAMAHAASVIGVLLYLPFGKLFHIVQRPLSLGVSFYKKAGQAGARAHCLRCGEDYGSRMHIEDLKTVLDQLGFNFRFGDLHYQEICPRCRRRLLALNQGRALGR
jgi:O-antigen/teichoic acid export membrane protein